MYNIEKAMCCNLLNLDITAYYTDSRSAPSREGGRVVVSILATLVIYFFKKTSEAYVARHLLNLGGTFSLCLKCLRIKNVIIKEKKLIN